MRRTNEERTKATRQSLIATARQFFTEKGYSETSTPEIASAAGMTRGALYHHFEDKKALFRAVVEREASDVAKEVEQATTEYSDAITALIAGSRAWLETMSISGRVHILLIDAPAVLGRKEIDDIDSRNGNRTLREGIRAAILEGSLSVLPIETTTTILGAAFDRAALALSQGYPKAEVLAVLEKLVMGLATRKPGTDV
ncbi:MAG: TetR/AcrR family transcriptional regulator [Rhizobiaceae bacterium]